MLAEEAATVGSKVVSEIRDWEANIAYATVWLIEMKRSPWRVFFFEMNDVVLKELEPVEQGSRRRGYWAAG